MLLESADSFLQSDIYLTQLWNIDYNDTYTGTFIKPYSDKNAILEYHQYKEIIRLYRIPQFMEYESSDYSTWIIDGGIIETAQETPANRHKLNTFNMRGSGSTNDKWILEPVTAIPNGIKLIDEHYEDSVTVQTRYISLNSVKSLNDLKIRVLSYYRYQSSMSVTWESSDSSIATVYNDGSVRGNKAGTVTITATYYPGATPYTESYTLTVMPYKDGAYNITNKLLSKKIVPQLYNYDDFSGYYLKESTNSNDNAFWYLQAMIDGTYRISVANYDNNALKYWVARDFESECVELIDYAEYMDNLSTWSIIETELGSVIPYKGDENYSWRLLDSGYDVVDLCEPDYEDYESMWRISKIVEHEIPTIYIHPYYDSQFLATFENDEDAAVEAIYEYLNYSKDIFESQLGINVVINEPIEFVLPESDANNLNVENVVNEGGVDDEFIIRSSFSRLINQLKGNDEDYLDTNKYILYQAYPFVTARGIRYTPRSGNVGDASHIYCTDGNGRNKYATLHEISHSFGVPDHYHNNDGENGECTVGERCTDCGSFMHKRTPFCAINYDYYDESEPFCDECLIEMRAALYFKCYPDIAAE